MQAAERVALVARLSREQRMSLLAEIEAANLRDAIGEALATARRPAVLEPCPGADLPAVMGVDAAAAYVGIGVNAMRDLLRADAITHRRQGRRYLVRREVLDEWMRAAEGRERAEHEELMNR